MNDNTRQPLKTLALLAFLMACGSLTTVGGAMVARYLFHERIMWDTTLASVCTAIPWLIVALLMFIVHKIVDGRKRDHVEQPSHRRH